MSFDGGRWVCGGKVGGLGSPDWAVKKINKAHSLTLLTVNACLLCFEEMINTGVDVSSVSSQQFFFFFFLAWRSISVSLAGETP